MIAMSQTQDARRFEHSACSDCGSHISVDNREMSVEDDELQFDVSCESADCSASGTIVIDSDGTSSTGDVDYHFASESPFGDES